MAKNNDKKKKNLSILEEEQIFSPWQTAFNNFKTKKLAVGGVFMFAFIFLSCMILPFFFQLDKTFHDPSQMNTSPTFSLMKVPSSLSRNARKLTQGATFGAGIDNDGKVYQWGVLTEKLKNIPEDMGKLINISAGLDHIIAQNSDNMVFNWGNDRMGLRNIPMEIQGKKLVQLEAGYQISTALDEDGYMYVWGNENITKITPGEYQGRITKYALNTTTAIAVLDDKTVATLVNMDTPYSRIPESIQGKVVDIASTDKAAAAVLEDRTVVVWGSLDYGISEIPEQAQGHIVAIEGGRNHLVALLDDGSVVAWGKDDKGQTDVPKISGAKEIDVGYYQNYAIDGNGKLYKWGLSGYLMGTDHFGRDVFVRLIYAGRMSMTVGAVAIMIQAFIGIIIGGISGFYGGKVDILMMRFAEIVNSIPFLPIAIILSDVIGNKIPETGRIIMIMCIIGMLNWPSLARLTRAQILAERENEFVTAAKAMGIKESIIIFRHILPNILPIILVNITLGLALSMLTESSLSFLGFGVREPSPTWGNMLNSCIDSTVIANYWWRWLFPSIALGLSTLSINVVGDGFRDAVDPKSNER